MSKYVRKTDRPHIQLDEAQIQAVQEWYRAKVALGMQKQFAARIGAPEHQVQRIVAEMRRGEGLSIRVSRARRKAARVTDEAVT